MTAHTPGPWEATAYPDGHTFITGGPEKKFVANAGGHHHADNARLIAAAPDMLHALLGLQVIAEQNLTDLCASAQEGAALTAVDHMEIVRWSAVGAAIAKATGA